MIIIIINFIAPDKSKSALELLRDAGYAVSSPCGGNGTCGKCKIKLSGSLSSPDSSELKLLSEDYESGYRLACMTYPHGDFSAELDEESERGMMVVTDIESLNMASEAENEPKSLSPVASGLGAAVDIGTTTVAVFITDLDKGNILWSGGFANPQASYGADVISRIAYTSSEPGGLEKLRDLICGSIEAEITRAGYPVESIAYMTIAGNTVMQHIAAGLDPSTIAVAPFTPKSLFGEEMPASDTGFANLKCPVYFMPCAASYVGGDILSGLCASKVDLSDKLALFIDIGTNGEVALGNRDGIVTCSCAAGPAFEGANLACGMAGADGAICRIKADGGFSYDTIGGAAARGICGSAIIDLTAYLLDKDLIDESGFMEDNFNLTDDGRIYLSPRDVREIQLAKAAVSAAVLTLLEKEGRSVEDICSVKLAGGFGSFIDKNSACRIGLLPTELLPVIEASGNTSGAGAVSYLIDGDFRERISNLAGTIKYIELSSDPVFMEKYIDQMCF